MNAQIKDKMKIRILFDKETENKNLHTGWGISFLVGGKILFDTGENGIWLMKNMKNLNVDIAEVKAVVISHDHWDHHGGLWGLLKRKNGLTVYACPNFSAEFKNKVKRLGGTLKENKKTTEILKNIFVTGEIEGEYKDKYMPEQALVIKTGNGISVITGCAHPGIIKILNTVKKNFPKENIYAALGGFHLMNRDKGLIAVIADAFKKMGVIKTGATHCSGPNAEEIFKLKYKKDFLPIKVGREIQV